MKKLPILLLALFVSVSCDNSTAKYSINISGLEDGARVIKGTLKTRGSHKRSGASDPAPSASFGTLCNPLFATMRLLSSRAARVSGPSGSLCALLALLLLTPPGPLASGESARPAERTRRVERSGVPGVGKCPGRAGWGRALPATCPITVSLLSQPVLSRPL